MEEQRSASKSERYAANIRQVPSLFDQAVSNLPDDVLRRRLDPDEWSAIEILGHMIDQDELVRQNNYLVAERPILLKALSAACEQFANLVERTDPALLCRKGRHSELGRISGADCIEIPLQAANDHLAQLRRAVGIETSSEGRAS